MVRITFTLYFVMAACITICMAAAIPDTDSLDITALADLTGGDEVCSLARRQVIATLRATTRDVQRVGSAASRNAAVRTAVRRAQTGMREATSGITQVAFTLLGGDEPTKESKDLIAKGFGGVKTALDAMTASKPSASLTTRITRARTSLNRAIAAGNKLVVDCAGSDPIPISTGDAEPAEPTRTRGRNRTIILTSSSKTSSSTSSETATTTASDTLTDAPAEPTITERAVA